MERGEGRHTRRDKDTIPAQKDCAGLRVVSKLNMYQKIIVRIKLKFLFRKRRRKIFILCG